MFNKYLWLNEQIESLKEYIRTSEDVTVDELYDQLHIDIDNDCIYYADCFDIIKGLDFIDFKDTEFQVTNVSEAAYAALYEYAMEEIDFENVLEETLREGDEE